MSLAVCFRAWVPACVPPLDEDPNAYFTLSVVDVVFLLQLADCRHACDPLFERQSPQVGTATVDTTFFCLVSNQQISSVHVTHPAVEFAWLAPFIEADASCFLVAVGTVLVIGRENESVWVSMRHLLLLHFALEEFPRVREHRSLCDARVCDRITQWLLLLLELRGFALLHSTLSCHCSCIHYA